MKRVIILPDGRTCSLASYCAGWRRIKTLAPVTCIGNWSNFPTEADAILPDLHFGMHERINSHIPGFGHGTPEFQRRFRWHHDSNGLSIVLYNIRRIG